MYDKAGKYKGQKVNPFGVEARIFWESLTILDVNALAPCNAKSSAVMVFCMHD